MGLFSSSTPSAPPAPLQGLGAPIGVFQEFTQHRSPLTLKLREKKLSWSGDDFKISLVNGQPFLKIDGSALSLRSKKTMLDMQGKPILNIQKKLLTIHTEFKIFPGETEETEIFHVRCHFQLLGTKMTVTFTNFDGRATEIHIKGDYFDRNATFTVNEQPVGRVTRSFFNAGEFLTDTQTYYLEIAPGVDAAMLVACCVCLDERANEAK